MATHPCLENSMDRGAWQVTESDRLKRLSTLKLLILLHVDIKWEPSQSNRVQFLVEQVFRNIHNNNCNPILDTIQQLTPHTHPH